MVGNAVRCSLWVGTDDLRSATAVIPSLWFSEMWVILVYATEKATNAISAASQRVLRAEYYQSAWATKPLRPNIILWYASLRLPYIASSRALRCDSYNSRRLLFALVFPRGLAPLLIAHSNTTSPTSPTRSTLIVTPLLVAEASSSATPTLRFVRA